MPFLANIGLPMIAVYWPAAWAGLVLVVAIEAMVGMRTLKLSVRQSLLGAGLANLFSTAIGIPLTWLLLAIPQVLFFGNAAGIDTFWERVFAVTVQSPWLIPYEENYSWMVPCALLSVSVPFWVSSTASEWLIVRVLFPSLPRAALWKWQWQGNAMSYAALCVGMLIALAAGFNLGWLLSSSVLSLNSSSRLYCRPQGLLVHPRGGITSACSGARAARSLLCP